MLKKEYKYYVLFLLTVLLVKGCGIFETRDPETPQTVRSTYFPPTTADIVVENLTYSILEKNSENYSKCISPVNFQYIPDSKSQLQYKLIFASWDNISEKKYVDNLITRTEPSASSVLFLDNERLTQITPDSAMFQATYIVVFQHNQANIPKSARGNIVLSIATNENDLFYIRKWEDFRQNDTDFTWSELRANFNEQ